MNVEQIIQEIRTITDDGCNAPASHARKLCDAYEALRAKYRQVMDAARVNEDAPTVSGYDPSGDERTVSLRWPSGNLHCYDRKDMRTVDLMEAQIDELRAKAECLETIALEFFKAMAKADPVGAKKFAESLAIDAELAKAGVK